MNIYEQRVFIFMQLNRFVKIYDTNDKAFVLVTDAYEVLGGK